MVKGLVKERGNPMKRLTYTHASIDTITQWVREKGFAVGKNVVNHLLWGLGFSLRGNKKALHKKTHKDRDRQFRYIDRLADGFLKSNNPVVSIDAKKTEKVGNFANPGKTWQAKGENTLVEDHNFGRKDTKGKIMKAIPYAVYDIRQNKGYVNVGTDHNTGSLPLNP